MALVTLEEVVTYYAVELGPGHEPLSLVEVAPNYTLTKLEGRHVWEVGRSNRFHRSQDGV